MSEEARPTRGVPYEATMTTGNKVTLNHSVISEVIEKTDGRTFVKTRTGSNYHLLDSYYDVHEWFITGIVKPR